jgi:shikimate kinase
MCSSSVSVRNIVLIGFMGTGKSVVGKRLAAELGLSFFDTDSLIEARTGMKIAEIFEKHGEAAFREIEKEVVREVSQKERCVISTGGGVVTDAENVRNLTSRGELICLTASPETILKRIERRANARPLLSGENPLERIRTLLQERRPFYTQASFTLDTTYLSIDKIVEAIRRRMRAVDG